MRRNIFFTSLTILAIVFLNACNHVPDQTRYIPKDAAFVLGVNTKAISKKVAWETIMGSKVLDQFGKNSTLPKMFKDLGEAGISTTTIYAYLKAQLNADSGNKLILLLPLDNAGKWETYVKNEYPQAVITQAGTRREANLPYGMYAGWTNSMLIVIYNLADYIYSYSDSLHNTPVTTGTGMPAAMADAFGVTEENSIAGNHHFKKLAGKAHDIISWINYDVILSKYMESGKAAANMGGVTMANTLWKDAALAAGYDFDNGRISGDMNYYVSDDLKSAAREMGATNADRDMTDRLPKQNLDVLFTWHLSPKGLKAMLDKLGMLGLANIALQQQNMDVDTILDAFTGDMAFTINDLAVKNSVNQAGNSLPVNYVQTTTPQFTYTFVFKINKKENFNKLLGMATSMGLTKTDNNTYVMQLSPNQSIYLATDNNFAVISNNQVNAANYLHSNNKGQKIADKADIYGHPFAAFADFQMILSKIDPSISHSARDSAVLMETRKVFSCAKMNGGSFKDDGFEYTMELDMVNANENSLLQLINYAMRMDALKHQ